MEGTQRWKEQQSNKAKAKAEKRYYCSLYEYGAPLIFTFSSHVPTTNVHPLAVDFEVETISPWWQGWSRWGHNKKNRCSGRVTRMASWFSLGSWAIWDASNTSTAVQEKGTTYHLGSALVATVAIAIAAIGIVGPWSWSELKPALWKRPQWCHDISFQNHGELGWNYRPVDPIACQIWMSALQSGARNGASRAALICTGLLHYLPGGMCRWGIGTGNTTWGYFLARFCSKISDLV